MSIVAERLSPGHLTEGVGTAWRRRFSRLPADRAALAAVISVLAALLPIVVSAVRTAVHRWVPVGDNGLLLLRTADVGTSHHPLLGTWTSASLTAGKDFNNPGPLLWDVLALPVKVLGYGIGMPIGLALMNGGCVVGAALVARRQAGSWAVVPTMVAAAGLAWSMGSELLVDPWQPHSMLMPFFALVVVLWGIVCGDLILVPWFAAIASLLVQTHLSYSFLVLFFSVGLAAAVAVHLRRSSRTTRVSPLGPRPIGLATVAVVVVLWSQTAIEQFFGEGEGNLSRLLSSASGDQTKIGLRLGTRLIADVIVLPPWFARWSFVDAVPSTGYTGTGESQRLIVGGVTSFVPAALAVVAFVALVGLLLWRALRNGRRVEAAALAVVEGLMFSAIAAMVVMPAGILGLSPHQMRWLWPMAALCLTAVVASAIVILRLELVTRRVTTAFDRRSRSSALSVGAGVAVLFGVAACPTYFQAAGPTADHRARPSIVAMMAQMKDLEGSGPLLFDDSGLRFAEPYSGAMMARLGELGVPFEVAGSGLLRQVGDGRKVTGTAQGRLYLREGDEAVDVPVGVDRVAFVPGLTDVERVERDNLIERWTNRLADGYVGLDEAGIAALGSGELGMSQLQVDGLDDPRGVVELGLLSAAAGHHLLDLGPADVAELVRLEELQTKWRLLTVGLFLAPITS